VGRTPYERGIDEPVTPGTRARNYATWNGRDSFQEWIGREPARNLKLALLRPDASWNDVHRVLSNFNLEYRTKGSGAVIVDITEPDKLHAKASHLSRFASRGRLEARLGLYQEPADAPPNKIASSYRKDVEERGVQVEGRTPERGALYKRFNHAVAEWREARARASEVAWQNQLETERSRRAHLRDENRELRMWIHSSAPKRDKQILTSLDSIRAAVRREDLDAQFVQERNQLRARLRGGNPGPWRAWLVHGADNGDATAEKALRRLRYGTGAGPQITGSSLGIGVVSSAEPPRRAILNNLGWFADSVGVNYVSDGRTIFSDEGKRIVFRDLSDDQVRAGFALAREKWSRGLCLSGTESFREKATRLSDEMGIKVLDGALRRDIPDLQALSRRYGKPILECKPRAGHQYSGRLVAAGVDGTGSGVVVIDAGRTLAVLRTDVKTVASLPPTGAWVRGRATNAHSFGGDDSTLSWRLRELERPELRREIGGIDT
jgi:hypothetical protein